MADNNYTFRDGIQGLIPWNLKEFQEVHNHIKGLETTPMDDWDLTDVRMILEDEGVETEYTFEPFNPLFQLCMKIKEMYPDHVIGFAHSIRFDHIFRFLKEYEVSLIKDDLIRMGDDEMQNVKETLLECLCVMAYSMKINSDGEEEYYFSYEQVLVEIEKLEKEEL